MRRMSEKELRKFVMDFCNNHIFTSAHIPSAQLSAFLSRVFIPFMFMDQDAIPDSSLVGLLWEYYDKAMPGSVNGMPMFASLHLMHKDDWEIVKPMILAEDARRAEFLGLMV